MLTRRALLLTSATAPLSAWADPAAPELAFEVLRDGTRIGGHRISFTRDGGTLTAAIRVDITVTLGPITLYRYTHAVTEVWRDDVFQSLASETSDNGKPISLRAVRSATEVTIDAPGGRTTWPSDAIPLTHWNILCTRRPLFNPEDGTPIGSRSEAKGRDTVTLADGRAVQASHFALVGKTALDDWYDDRNAWVALKTLGRDGSKIEYRRLG
jgi:Family of unknown function (DUF6134)